MELTFFSGTSTEAIARWCRCSAKHAQAVKRGHVEPSARMVALFTIYRTNKVMDPALWEGWSVQGDKIFTPEGGAIEQWQLRALPFIMAMNKELQKKVSGGKGQQRSA